MDSQGTSPLKREILLCGGPNHGEWVEVGINSPAYYVRKYKEQNMVADLLASGPPMLPEVEQHLYQIKPIQMTERKSVIWIGMHSDVKPMDHDRVMAKALFQRDVYARMYGPER